MAKNIKTSMPMAMPSVSASPSKGREENDTRPALNAFARFTDILDEHIQLVRIGVVLMGFTGVVMIGRSIRLMKKFYSVSEIPEEFIRKQITLRGKVKGHESDHLTVEHLPIMQGWNLTSKKSQESSLAVHLAGVRMTEDNLCHLVAMTPRDSLIWFKLQALTPEQGLDCIVYRKRRWLPSKQVNVGLVKQGLASIRPLHPPPGADSSAASDSFMQSLVKAEMYAERKAKGMWAKPTLRERLLEKRGTLYGRVNDGLSTLTRPFVAAASAGQSIATKATSLLARLRRSSR